MTANTFEIVDLSSQKDLTSYLDICSKIKDDNPFIKFDLTISNDFSTNKIKYFLLSVNNEPIIIMPIIIRNISINKLPTKHKDVISPYGYSGPLISEKATELEITIFWKEVDLWYNNNNIISEFIRFSLDNNTHGYNGVLKPTLDNVCGDIVEENLQWTRFDKKVRNNYRKAEVNQLKFELFTNKIEPKIVNQFYDIYKNTMIRRSADIQLYFSLDYFENYTKSNPNHCAIAMVYKNEVPISTEFLLLSNNKIYSYLGGTNSEYFNCRPNDFLKVNIINWARIKNFKQYILGGGRINNDNLYTYKKSFFPKEKDIIFFTGRKILNQNTYDDLSIESQNTFGINNIINSDITEFFPAYRNPNNSITI
ncbi:GNAT family N-acetyltransferase [Maribacter sp. BPC-D8]|uniref:GNAT family N-acetyltransferase n=1 Tax=Maribacter sp. BPC-D8 TaxID=3053613 RepID=UPI002B49DD37|nr:GNAT family N-acetyltransferase [Maribacter sp. BPC-D8]WRI31294.1 GNAT family N-acetyltransferase [Maribacter sp. BPC-D8]